MKPAPHVRANMSDDDVILLDVQTGEVLSANPIGARIWAGLEHGLSVSSIVDGIVGDTGAKRSAVNRDVIEFVHTLMARALAGEL